MAGSTKDPPLAFHRSMTMTSGLTGFIQVQVDSSVRNIQTAAAMRIKELETEKVFPQLTKLDCTSCRDAGRRERVSLQTATASFIAMNASRFNLLKIAERDSLFADNARVHRVSAGFREFGCRPVFFERRF